MSALSGDTPDFEPVDAHMTHERYDAGCPDCYDEAKAEDDDRRFEQWREERFAERDGVAL